MLRSAKNPVLQCDIHSLCLQRPMLPRNVNWRIVIAASAQVPNYMPEVEHNTMTDSTENVQRCSERTENRNQKKF